MSDIIKRFLKSRGPQLDSCVNRHVDWESMDSCVNRHVDWESKSNVVEEDIDRELVRMVENREIGSIVFSRRLNPKSSRTLYFGKDYKIDSISFPGK